MKFVVDQMLDGQEEVLNQKYGDFGNAGAANMGNYQHLANAMGSVQSGNVP